jgi:hypothetical protein
VDCFFIYNLKKQVRNPFSIVGVCNFLVVAAPEICTLMVLSLIKDTEKLLQGTTGILYVLHSINFFPGN